MANEEANNNGAQQNATLRIDADRVSALMDLVGELGLSVGEVVHHPDLAGLELENFHIAVHRLNLLVQEAQDVASSLSLIPVKTVFSRMRRLVRELSSKTGKTISLNLEGEDVEVDKRVVDSLYDPLVHIVRNSADHGLETDEERQDVGKSLPGIIKISAVQHGTEIQIIIEDDGRGLNRDKIISKARERGIIGETEEPPDDVVFSFIFHPGFSTSEQVSNLSGRGVGMDVVNNTLKNLRGSIQVDSKQGVGTTITLKIPMTLAFLECLIVRVDSCLCVIPIDEVLEVFKPEADIIMTAAANNSEAVKVRGSMIPVQRLQDYYGMNSCKKSLSELVLIMVRTSKGAFCIPVDEIIGQQQVTMKPLSGRLKDIRASSGCAILSTGEIAIALDCERLIQKEVCY